MMGTLVWCALFCTMLDVAAGVSNFLLEQKDCMAIDNIRSRANLRRVYNMDVYHTVTVHDSLWLRLSRNPLLYTDKDEVFCKVGFVASRPGHRILLAWHTFTVGEKTRGKNWVHVMDYESDFDLSDSMWGVKGKRTPIRRPPPTQDYHSIGKGLSIAYKGKPYFDDFSIVLTEFKDINRTTNSCDWNYYQCEGNYDMCISARLHCDGTNNCGDSNESDENLRCIIPPTSKTNYPPPHSPSVHKDELPLGLIGALAGIFVISFIMLSAFCVYQIKRRSNWRCPAHARAPQDINTLSESHQQRASNVYSPMPSNTMPNSRPKNLVISASNPPYGASGSSARMTPSISQAAQSSTENEETHMLVMYRNMPGNTSALPILPTQAAANHRPSVLAQDLVIDRSQGMISGEQYYYDMDEIFPLYHEIS